MANPNPSPSTRFKKGDTPNPGGKSSELRRLHDEAAEMAAKLRHAMLSSMMESLKTGIKAADLIDADALRLMKDSEDRAHGTPKQAVEMTGRDGGPIKLSAIDPTKMSDAALAELLAARVTDETPSSDGS